MIAALLLVLSLLLLTACGTGGSSDNKRVKTLYMGMVNAPAGFNPINNVDVAAKFAQGVMFDPFLNMTAPLEFKPKLANSIETSDNTTYTINLNPKAKWSDSKPLTADDVIFTFNLIANPKTESGIGFNLSMIEGLNSSGKLTGNVTTIPSLKKIDAHTVTFKTKFPIDPNYIKEFIGTQIFTLPKHILKNVAPEDLAQSKYMQKPNVTSGPYQFVTYSKNTYIQYKANNYYYLGKPKIPKLFIKIMPASNLAAELQSGSIQMNVSGSIGNVPIQDINAVKNQKNLTTKINSQISFFQMMLYNVDTISNPNVRQALSMAVNRQQIVDKLLKGHGEVVDGPFASGHPYHNDQMKATEYNSDKAKKLLKDAGWDFSRELKFAVPLGNKVREQAADIIVQSLKAIGVKVKETTYDFPTLMQKAKDGDFDMMLIGYPVTADPDVRQFYAHDSLYGFTRYNNPKSDKLLDEGRKETDQTKRKAIYDQLQLIWQKDMPLLPLYTEDEPVVVNKALEKGGASAYWPGTLADLQDWSLKK